MCTARIYNKLLNDTDAKLLFDYSHAFVSCFNRGTDFESYAKPIVNKKCIQMHLCEVNYIYQRNVPICIDAHDIPSPKTTSKAVELVESMTLAPSP